MDGWAGGGRELEMRLGAFLGVFAAIAADAGSSSGLAAGREAH